MKKILYSIVFLLFSQSFYAQSTKGNRTLAWQIDMAENNNYDSAFVYGKDACMESVHLFCTWTDVEPDTANFNTTFISNFFETIDIYYPASGVEVELQIAPTNTGVKEVPSELMGLPFDHPAVINRFKILLDTVFANIPNVTLSALNIGNESDLNFGTNMDKYEEFKTFIDSIQSHAKALYFDIHGTDLKFGTTFTHHGLVDNSTASLCKMVNNGLDVITTTYYPLNGDFTMKPPSIVNSDFEALVMEYPDTSQPIYFAECGYPSSAFCNSSEAQQSEFWSEVFTAWDTYSDNIKHLTIFKSTDWSTETVNQLGQYYGLQDTIFKEYLRTLGVRTWEGNGSNKQAYETILCELNARNWCEVNCVPTNLEVFSNNEDLVVYPTPAKNEVIIQFNNSFNNSYTFKLYNTKGQLLRTLNGISETFTLNRNKLKSGIYIFQLISDNNTIKLGKLIFD